jgi:hypothetical protein
LSFSKIGKREWYRGIGERRGRWGSGRWRKRRWERNEMTGESDGESTTCEQWAPWGITIISANMMVRATRGLQGLGLDDVDRLRASTK